ncbi:MAG: DUF4148 domain-containing protein [Burkholderiaceae bacterium]
MKTRPLIAAVIALSAFATAGSALADRPSEEPIAVSTKSRAEVRAELDQARAEGLLMYGDRDDLSNWSRPGMGAYGVAGSRYSVRTRDEVRAEAIEYARSFPSGSDEMYGK